MQNFIKINPKDNVVVALTDLKKDTILSLGEEGSLSLKEPVPSGHKIAIREIPAGHEVIKYGSPIGTASDFIPAGCKVHTHNLKTSLGDILDYTYTPKNNDSKEEKSLFSSPSEKEEITFPAFLRSDGSVGIRNEIWILPTVGCVNHLAAAVARKVKEITFSDFADKVDDVIAFCHPYGCSQMGEDQENSRKILCDLMKHPNAGGVLVLGLGCENSGVDILKEYLGEYDPKRIRFLVSQEVEDEIEEGILLVKELLSYASSFQREPVGISNLIVGLKCGGSDGFSGITANPLVGRFSDRLVFHGGSTILTEVPEMFGAETLLMNRCNSKETFQKTVELINNFKTYYKKHGQTIYENPSPGNKAGGISTLEDKSLGCTQKSGTSPVVDVLSYGEKLQTKGLNLLSSPGNDLVASTALAASGAHIILFTTGRGTPFASPVPTVKISTNTDLYHKKNNWIDFNAGTLVHGKNMEELEEEFFRYVLAVASGEKVKSELAGYHDMAIFKQGVTL